MQYWWLISLSIITGVAGQTTIKLGVSQLDAKTGMTGPFALFAPIFQSPLVLFGLILYGVGALAWIAVLAKLDLSHAYPFLAANFVLIALMSRLVLHEPISLMRWFGIAFICVGIFFVTRGNI